MLHTGQKEAVGRGIEKFMDGEQHQESLFEESKEIGLLEVCPYTLKFYTLRKANFNTFSSKIHKVNLKRLQLGLQFTENQDLFRFNLKLQLYSKEMCIRDSLYSFSTPFQTTSELSLIHIQMCIRDRHRIQYNLKITF